jgi:cytidylate kinase
LKPSPLSPVLGFSLMDFRRILIVGPSGSGKTTVARLVAGRLGLPLVSMDDFRIKGRLSVRLPSGDNVRTFEHPALWDADRLAIRLFDCLETANGFVAEGNHLLHYAIVRAIPDTLRFYIDVPFEVSLQRRSTRGATPHPTIHSPSLGQLRPPATWPRNSTSPMSSTWTVK